MEKYLKNLRAGTYIVIGDLIVDAYDIGKVLRISPEAPVPILNFERRIRAPGGAANVAMNLAGLGNHVELIGLIGDDEAGHWLKNFLDQQGVGTKGIIFSEAKLTTNKVRFGTTQQTILRVDYEDSRHASASVIGKMITYAEQYLRDNQVDGVIVSDYNKGLIVTEDEVSHFKAFFEKLVQMQLLCGVDTKKSGTDLRIFKNFGFIKPNQSELEKAVSMKVSDMKDLPKACQKYLEMSQAKTILVTLGGEGLYYFDGAFGVHIPTVTASVYDVTGAGDTVFAITIYALANGLSWTDAMRLANIAASSVIESRGTKAISMSELYRRVKVIENTQPIYFIS